MIIKVPLCGLTLCMCIRPSDGVKNPLEMIEKMITLVYKCLDTLELVHMKKRGRN